MVLETAKFENGEVVTETHTFEFNELIKDEEKALRKIKKENKEFKNLTCNVKALEVESQKFGITKELFMQYAQPITEDFKGEDELE